MKEKIINFLKSHYWKIIVWIILLVLPALYFANIWWIADQIKNAYYKWRITTNFKKYVYENNYKLFDKDFKFKNNLSNDFIMKSIKNNKCENLFEKRKTEYWLYAYKIDKCFNSWKFYVFDWELWALDNSVDSWENIIYSIDKWIDYNIIKYKQGKIFYLNKREKLSNLIDLADLGKDIDKTYFYKSWDVYEISLKYKNSTKWIKIIFDTKTDKIKNQLDLQYMACDDKTQKCWNDFADKIKELKFEDLVWAKILKWKFKTGTIESIQIKLDWWNCINKTYQITWNLLTGVNYTFPIKITWTWNCTQLLAKVILKWKNGINYVKKDKIGWYFLIKEFNKNIKILSHKSYGYAYVLYYTSWYNISLSDENPYLITAIRNSGELGYKYLPQIDVYWTWRKYIIWMIYSWADYWKIINFDTKTLTQRTEKVEKKYFRCDKKTHRCYNDFKEKVVSLWVKNFVNKALISWILKDWTIKSASVVLSWCINKIYQITWSLYSGINYTFPIKVNPNSKCRKIKWIINLTWTNNISYSKKFKLNPSFFVDNLWHNLYKLRDWYNAVLAYAKQDLKKNVRLISLTDNDKIHLYISWDVYHIWITYSWTNIWQIIDFDTKNEKILKNEKSNYIVCDKETNWCYDQFKDIVDDIIVKKNGFWWTIIWILKEWKVKKVIIQPIESKNCNLDTSPYEPKKFYAWNIFFKYDFALKYKNICSNWWKFKIILEWFDWKKYETTISVVWDFYNDRYKPEKLVLLKKICKVWDKWRWNNTSNNWLNVDSACYYGYFTTKSWKIWIYQFGYDWRRWLSFNLTTNINISSNKNNYQKNLVHTLINTYFNIDRYNWIVSYYNSYYKINESFNFKRLDDSFDIINYSWFNFYKQWKQLYIKAPKQDILMTVNINLGCEWPFCEDLTKFDWTKADDPDLIKHKWKDIIFYEKKWKYYILDKKLENGKYLIPLNINLDNFINRFIWIWWVSYITIYDSDTTNGTYQLNNTYKYVKTVQVDKVKRKIYEKDWNYYIDGWNWFLQNFVVKIERLK